MKAKIYMKSGSVINLRGIKNISFKYSHNNDQVTGISFKWRWYYKFLPCQKLIVGSLDLRQIEAVTTQWSL